MNNVLNLQTFRKIKELKNLIEDLGYRIIIAEYESAEYYMKDLKKQLIRKKAQLQILNLSKEA